MAHTNSNQRKSRNPIARVVRQMGRRVVPDKRQEIEQERLNQELLDITKALMLDMMYGIDD